MKEGKDNALDWTKVKDVEYFNGFGTRKKGESLATISNRGLISLSTGFVQSNKKFFLNYDFIKLAYIKSKNAILIELLKKEEKHKSYKIRKNNLYSFYSRSFFRKFNMNYKDPKIYGRYQIEQVIMPNEAINWAILLDEKQR